MLDAFHVSRLTAGLLWTVVGLILAFLIAPSLIVVPISFSASNLLEFPPHALSLRWYANFFGSPTWMSALRVSLTLGALTALISTPIGWLAGVSIVKTGGARAEALYGLILIPALVPGILLAIGLFFVLAGLRLVGTLGGILLGHVVLAIPVALIVLLPAVRRFDWPQVDAARSLGAGWARALVGIMLPQLSFSIFAAAMMAFLTSLDEAVISIFVASGPNSTLPKLMFLSLRDQIDPTIAAISSLWLLLVSLCMFVLSRRGPALAG